MVEKTEMGAGRDGQYVINTLVKLPLNDLDVEHALNGVRQAAVGGECRIETKEGEHSKQALIHINFEKAGELSISLLDDAIFRLGKLALGSARVTGIHKKNAFEFYIGPNADSRKLKQMNMAYTIAVSSMVTQAEQFRGGQANVTGDEAMPAMRGLFAGKPMTLVVGYFEAPADEPRSKPVIPATLLLEGNAEQAHAQMLEYIGRVDADPGSIEPMMTVDHPGPIKGRFTPLHYLDQKEIVRYLAKMDPGSGGMETPDLGFDDE